MAEKGQELRGPGIAIRFLELEPELLAMDVAYDGQAGMPPAHYHPRQAERFTVLEGAMHTIIGDEERVYEEGDEFEVPVAAVHQMSPHGGPARVRWEVRPALRAADFFETLYSGEAGDDFLEEFADEFRLA